MDDEEKEEEDIWLQEMASELNPREELGDNVAPNIAKVVNTMMQVRTSPKKCPDRKITQTRKSRIFSPSQA